MHGSRRTGSPIVLPDYRGGGIVNLMASIAEALGADAGHYAPLQALPPERLEKRNVVLLVVDGLGYEYLRTRGREGALQRHLQGRMTSVFPSTTAAAITTFLTGTAPQQHGVTGWFMYFEEIGTVLAVLPYRPRDGGPVPAVSVRRLLEPAPLFDRLAVPAHVVAPASIVDSPFNVAHGGTARRHAFVDLEQMFDTVGSIVREQSTGGRYVYAYWPELDRLAHERGIASAEAAAELGRIDAAFDRFMTDIDGTGTTVVVTADHGFIDARADCSIDVADHPELGRHLALPLCGEQRAAYCYTRNGERHAFAEYVEANLQEQATLEVSEEMIEAGYFGLGTPHPRLRARIGDCTLIMKDEAVIRDQLPGARRPALIGVHGGMSPQEMYVPLIVANV